jgi:hypothetical protein
LKAGLWFRRGRLVMLSPVSGIYAKVRQKFHLSPLFKFPEPALHAGCRGSHTPPECIGKVM